MRVHIEASVGATHTVATSCDRRVANSGFITVMSAWSRISEEGGLHDTKN